MTYLYHTDLDQLAAGDLDQVAATSLDITLATHICFGKLPPIISFTKFSSQDPELLISYLNIGDS